MLLLDADSRKLLFKLDDQKFPKNNCADLKKYQINLQRRIFKNRDRVMLFLKLGLKSSRFRSIK
jgi:hypothetical protein